MGHVTSGLQLFYAASLQIQLQNISFTYSLVRIIICYQMVNLLYQLTAITHLQNRIQVQLNYAKQYPIVRTSR